MKNLTNETHTAITASGIIERPPEDLKPWANNPRTHSEMQLTKLRASIQKFGFTAPVKQSIKINSSHCPSLSDWAHH